MRRLILLPSTFILFLTASGQLPPPDPLPPAATGATEPAPSSPVTKPAAPTTQIRVTGNLITLTTAPDGRHNILFEGKVKIFGGGLTGTCDRLEMIGPDPAAPSGSQNQKSPPLASDLKSEISNLKSAPGQGTALTAFSKVIATGSVTITSAKHTAFAERAEIFPSPLNPGQAEKLVLSGKPKLTDGTQQITGGLITYRLSQTQVDVETDPAHPDERPTVVLESFP